MFETLTSRFDGILKRIRSKGLLGPEEVDEVLKEIRTALLDADVSLKVVRTFQERIRTRALGEEVSGVLNPGQQIVKIVSEELTNILGGESVKLTFASKPPTIVMLAGLQGSGKTTTAAKLAKWFKSQGRNPLLVAADLARPAAVEQLKTLGSQVGVPVFSENSDPVSVAQAGLEQARSLGKDVLICDTAGRLTIDQLMMEEVSNISKTLSPHYTFLVVDAMIGQESTTVAEAFYESAEYDGVILTKLDGDARGGAALSICEVTGKPIAFTSTGEKIEDFEIFHPDRLASRILGMGDVETLIEKAEEAFEEEKSKAAMERMLEGTFTLDDFLDQVQQIRKMGPISNVMGMLPGMTQPGQKIDGEAEERRMNRLEGIIQSMTSLEKAKPEIIDGSRRARIANGSGTQPSEVSQLIKQFREMKKMMKKVPKNSKSNKNKKKKKGGRTSPKGSISPVKKGLSLPGLGQDSVKESLKNLDLSDFDFS